MNENISEESKEIFNQAQTDYELHLAEEKKALLKIKNNLPPDKERFEINAFANMYDLTDDRGNLILDKNIEEDLEIQYYLKNPEIKSMEEFTNYRKNLDENDVG